MLKVTLLAILLAIVSTTLLIISTEPVVPTAQAGAFVCPSGECWTSVFGRDGCFHCLINPAPARCSCSQGPPSSCPASTTQCGNCSDSQSCGIVCSSRCPGCNSICQPGGPGTKPLIDNTMVTPIQPTFAEWVNSQSLLDGVSAFPLIRQMVLHMRQVKEQWGCSYLTGLVVDPNDPQHVQSKVIVHSNEFGVTTFTIFNRSTNQDEILIVHGARNMWQLRTEPSYASKTPVGATILAEGKL